MIDEGGGGATRRRCGADFMGGTCVLSEAYEVSYAIRGIGRHQKTSWCGIKPCRDGTKNCLFQLW